MAAANFLDLAGLDEPVRRYLTHALGQSAELHENVDLTLAGRIKLGRWWFSYTADEYFAGHEFTWSARVGWRRWKPLRVVDRYSAQRGSMDIRLGRLGLAHAADELTTRAAAGRGAAESIWVPASLLPDRGVTWRAAAEDRIVAEISVPPERAALELDIDDAGAVTRFGVQRWTKLGRNEYGYIPFGGDVSAEGRFGGVVIPSRVNVGWWFGTPRFTRSVEATVVTARPGPALSPHA